MNTFDFVCKKKLWVKDLNFCMDESMNKVQRQTRQWKKYLYVISLIRDLDLIMNSYKTTIKDNPINKWANDLNRCLQGRNTSDQ